MYYSTVLRKNKRSFNYPFLLTPQLLLCIVENLEVVLEIGAQQMYGDYGKWAVVATITLIK